MTWQNPDPARRARQLLLLLPLAILGWAAWHLLAVAADASLQHGLLELVTAVLAILLAYDLLLRSRGGQARTGWLAAALLVDAAGIVCHLVPGGAVGMQLKLVSRAAMALLLLGVYHGTSRRWWLGAVAGGFALAVLEARITCAGALPGRWLMLAMADGSGVLLLGIGTAWLARWRRDGERLALAAALFPLGTGSTTLLAITVSRHSGWWFWGWHLIDLASLACLGVMALREVLAGWRRLSDLSSDLVQSESRFRALTEHSADIIFILGPDGTYTYVSPAATRLSGLPEDQLLGRRPGGYVHPEDRRRVQEGVRRARNRPGEQVAVGQIRIRHADGHWLVLDGVYCSMVDVPGVEGIVLNYRDVTQQVQATEALQESQRRLTTLIGNLPGMVYRCAADPDLSLLYVSPGCESLLGYTARELTETRAVTAPEFIHPEDFPRVRTAVWEAVERREAFQLQYRVTHRSGELRWVWEHGRGVFGEDGRLASIEGYMLDVTDRVQAEQALRRTQFSINHASDAVYWVGRDGALVDVNATTCSVLGYSREELLGMTIFDIARGLDREQWRETWEMVKREGSVLIEGVHVTKDGHAFVVEVSSNYQEFDGQEFHCCFARDITERKEAEEAIRRLNQELEARVERRTRELRRAQQQLVTAEKMAALGNLVAGVAHEINTPLGIGVTAATFLQREVAEYERRYREGNLCRSDFEALLKTLADTARLLESNLSRAADLVQNFKQVSVDRSSEPRRRFRLKEHLEELLAGLQPRLASGGHTVHLACPDGLELDSYPGALAQILTNLVVNSVVHGFEGREGGNIGISVTRQGERVEVRYCDDGCGMDAEQANRVFDPFFTTRRGRGGSGLGMHIVYNLVTQVLGGRIELQTEPGRGATFLLEFPVTAAGSTDKRPAVPARDSSPLDELPVAGGIRV